MKNCKVYDTKTKSFLDMATTTFKRARVKADKLDLKYGACRYKARFVD